MTDYGLLFRELAIPRLVGSANHTKVREILTRELAARRFSVERHAFSGRPARALLATPRTVQGINLIASRPSVPPAPLPGSEQVVRPSVWLVAHYDSKGQPVSMALRLLGLGSLLIGLIGLLLAPIPALVAFVVGAAIAGLNRVNDNSPGAVDNATALVAIFMTLDQLPQDANVGVVFPDAEEFGLVGARALAAERADLFAGAALINLDGLDDVGRPIAFLHRPGKIGAAVASALGARRWRWLPVVVDGLALARVGGECITILKGNAQTMRVVHRPGDTAERVRLDGAATIAAGLARVLRVK
ncbi:MAG TPA: M28 family peptidase [Gemmatimonadales bacterium]|nr:M28 family peptidase [Gemmatimonadales bacterium]